MVAVRYIKIRISVVIEVPEIGGPRPATHFNSGLTANVFEFAVALILVQRISSRVTLIEFADFFRSFGMKLLLL